VNSPPCGARTEGGGRCSATPEPGKRRCRLHGGAVGAGARAGNRNAMKHGHYSARARARRRAIGELIRAPKVLIEELR